MRAFISIVIFISSSLCTKAQLSDANAFFNGTYDKAQIRKNKIKQVSVDIFLNQKISTYYIFQFNKEGFLEIQTILDSSRKKVNAYTFKYNKFGGLIERTNINYDLGKTYETTFIKTYNGSQLVSDKSSLLPIITEYTYNSKGQINETYTINAPDSLNNLKRKSIYKYDNSGYLQSIITQIVNSDGLTDILDTSTFTYDKSGHIVSVSRDNFPTYYISYNRYGLIKSKKFKMSEDFGNIEVIDNYNYTFWK